MRHAQAYWQKLLAQKVTIRSNQPDMEPLFHPNHIAELESMSDKELIDSWDNFVTHQAQLFCAAEMVLREKVRRGL